jgi:outer membrane protein assembly factor BamB
VVAGRLYTLMQDDANEVVLCLDVADKGKELWRHSYAAEFTGDYKFGPRSTPSVDGDLVFTVGATGQMHCLKTHAKTGKGEVVWHKDLAAEFDARSLRWGVSFSPLVVGDLVYIMPGGPGGNSLAALDKRTGKVRWRSLSDRPGYSSPIAGTLAGRRQIVFFTAEAVVGVDPDQGTELWRYAWETSYDCNIATPILAGDYIFISSGYDVGCGVLRIQDEGGGKLSAKAVYKNDSMHNHFSSSVRWHEHIYGFDESQLRCVDLRKGKVVWRQTGFRKGSLTIAGGQLILLGEYGKLALAEATPKGYKETASFQITRNKCWVVPVLADGRLFVRDEEKLMCIDLRGS